MAGIGSAKPSLAQTQQDERQRVADIIRRDQIAHAREDARRLAELEVREGVYVNISDSVVEPTPEWIAKGGVRRFTPTLPDGTVRPVKTVRRVLTPLITRMLRAGKITPEQFAACSWYAAQHEQAAMQGRWVTSRFRATSGTTGGPAPMAMNEREAIARTNFRAAREVIPARYLTFLDAAVLDDVPLSRAARIAKCRTEQAPTLFRDLAQTLADFCEQHCR